METKEGEKFKHKMSNGEKVIGGIFIGEGNCSKKVFKCMKGGKAHGFTGEKKEREKLLGKGTLLWPLGAV